MPDKPVFLTQEGKAKLEAELEHLRSVRRKEIAERIRAAKEGGDVTDNADYDDAKEQQAFVEGRILTIENMLRNAVIIETEGIGTDSVQLGSRVTVVDHEGMQETYTIVGSAEAQPSNGRISNESPVGRALIGRRVGDEVMVNVPQGTLYFKILSIE
jgi:transcription elongation factor GreA